MEILRGEAGESWAGSAIKYADLSAAGREPSPRTPPTPAPTARRWSIFGAASQFASEGCAAKSVFGASGPAQNLGNRDRVFIFVSRMNKLSRDAFMASGESASRCERPDHGR